MDKERLNLEPEVQEILGHIDNKDNFLLSGGAGSGKTYSLVQVIKQVIFENPTTIVACMTYTNSAVKEIEHRVKHQNLNVLTIHDFLWDNIKSFQKELKKSLVSLINDDEVKRIKNFEEPIKDDFFNHLEKGIQYKEFTIISEGIISHDEVIILANYMFKNYPKLCDILKDKFKFIFIDEYQDTNKAVIEIFLVHLKQSKKENIIGFFGDSMQSIYDDGIGDLNLFKGEEIGAVKEIFKQQNRRNPKRIIDLANKIRNDDLIQNESGDLCAPNMLNGVLIEGLIRFYYSSNDDVDIVKKLIDWNVEDSEQNKELNLTHNLIAPKAGFENLMKIYDGDKILEYKKRITDYIKANNLTIDFSAKSFGQVIEELNVSPTPTQQAFIDSNLELFNEAKEYSFAIFSKIYLDKDSLVDDKKQNEDDENKKGSKRDNLIRHLFKIQTNINLYYAKQYNDFLRKTEFSITCNEDKRNLKEIIETLVKMSDSTVEEVIEYANEKGICRKDDKINSFISKKEYVYNRVKKLKFSNFQNLYNYLEGYTPFSTQHKIKGAEFKNVLVILNNGDWNKYNFNYLFDQVGTLSELKSNKSKSKIDSFPTILSRTQKIFYVCCTRTKENLVLFYHKPSPAIIEKAKEWFGEENVYSV